MQSLHFENTCAQPDYLSTSGEVCYRRTMFVISLGGSIVVPDRVDTDFLIAFRAVLADHLRSTGDRVILVIGGGAPARAYQEAYRTALTAENEEESGADTAVVQDWIGIMATRLNAELVRHVMHPLCTDPVVYDPTEVPAFSGSVLVAAGWKPGFSTDFVAVTLAEQYHADTVVNRPPTRPGRQTA